MHGERRATPTVVPGVPPSVLGEGPCWDAATGTLLWVDIDSGKVHRFDPAAGTVATTSFGEPVGMVVPRVGGGIVVALVGRLVLLDPDGVEERSISIEEPFPSNRPNDGKCDPRGRIFIGTMDADAEPERGSLYRVESDGAVERVVDRVGISNGLGWSPDGATMYYIDSLAFSVDVFDYDLESGELTDRRVLVATDPAWGYPDGLTVADDGTIWVAFYDGAALRRFDPDGRLLVTIPFPTSRVTSACFGGPRLDVLYVTSGALDPPDAGREPEAGCLFRLDPKARGLPSYPFAG